MLAPVERVITCPVVGSIKLTKRGIRVLSVEVSAIKLSASASFISVSTSVLPRRKAQIESDETATFLVVAKAESQAGQAKVE